MTQTAKNELSALECIFSQLEGFWSQFQVNREIRESYNQLFHEISKDQAEKLADHELKTFENNSSLLVICLKNIETRDQSFSGIVDMDQHLKDVKGWEKNLQIITQCAEMLQGHRMITLLCVENLIRWSTQIFYFTGKRKELRIKRKNYLESMSKDSVFTQYTEMARFFRFSEKNDPLLLALADSVPVKLSTKSSNYFIKANKFSIPVPTSISNQVTEVQDIINFGLSEGFLIEKAKNFSLILQNLSESLERSNQKAKVDLCNYFLTRIIEEGIEILLYPAVKVQTDIALSKLILFRYLDLSKAVKGIVEESINELKTKKKRDIEKSKDYSSKDQRKTFIRNPSNSIGKADFPREDSRNTINSVPVASTRPSVSLNLAEGENPLQKLIISTRSIKGKISPNFNKSFRKSPEILKIQEKISAKVLKSKFLYDHIQDQNNDSIVTVNKSLKIKIKNPLLTSSMVKGTNSKVRNQNIKLLKTPEKELFSTIPPKIDEIRFNSTKSPLKRKIDVLEERKFDKFKEVDSKMTELKVINKPFTKLSPIILESSQNKRQAFNQLVIIEAIYRNLVETLIKEEKIEKISEECLKNLIIRSSRISEAEKNNYLGRINIWKLQTDIFYSILESFLSKSWLFDLASLMKDFYGLPARSRISSVDSDTLNTENLEEPEDFILEVFTPRIHSPNQVLSRIDSESEKTSQSSLPNSRESQFSKTRTTASLNLLKSSSKDLNHFFFSYLSRLPTAEKFYLSYEQTINLSLIGEDISWLSFNDSAGFKGILGFCSLYEKGKKVAQVFHVSTWESSFLGSLIKETSEFLKGFRFSSVLFRFRKIPDEVKLVAETLGLSIDLENETALMSFEHQAKDENWNLIVLNVKTICSENVLVGFQEMNKAMIEFGSHSFIAFHVLCLMNDKIEDGYLEGPSKIRLQQDIKDLVELYESEKSKKNDIFPYFHSNSGLYHKSQLELNFNWSGMSRFTHSKDSKSFLFMNFHQVYHCKTEHFLIYYLKTSDPKFEIALIVFPNIEKELESDMKSMKTDLFWKTENILQSTDEKVLLGKELCIPAFNKTVDWENTWMKGLRIMKNSLVSSCSERFSWTTFVPDKYCNSVGSGKKVWLQDQFIVAIIDLKLWQVLEVPLITALVRKEDWIEVSA